MHTKYSKFSFYIFRYGCRMPLFSLSWYTDFINLVIKCLFSAHHPGLCSSWISHWYFPHPSSNVDHKFQHRGSFLCEIVSEVKLFLLLLDVLQVMLTNVTLAFFAADCSDDYADVIIYSDPYVFLWITAFQDNFNHSLGIACILGFQMENLDFGCIKISLTK